MSEDAYRAALKRTVEAKRKMDHALIELERAEDEYHQAVIALDELEDACPPDASGLKWMEREA